MPIDSFTYTYLKNLKFKCKNTKEQELDQIEDNGNDHILLNEIQFKCPEGCTAIDPIVGINYENAFEHLKECEYEKYQCPFDCDDQIQSSLTEPSKGFFKSELNEHYKTCPFSTEMCPNCKV